MQKILPFISLLFLLQACSHKPETGDFITLFESSEGRQSAPYFEGIDWWKKLDAAFKEIRLEEYGMTDAGYPLHLVILSKEGLDLAGAKASDKTVILINNAIHAGEPDGVDASMMLFRDLLIHDSLSGMMDKLVLVCIPYYNIGGAINRGTFSRANQDGPEEYGFRGNAQNLDLNRDFMKCDSRNAQTFTRLLQALDPDIYVETHVSNGADYGHTLSYIATQADKLAYGMGDFLRRRWIPRSHKLMLKKGEMIIPYVNVHGVPLDSSYDAFYDLPRYSTGLAALHQIFGFITETHMLKPYAERVRSTYNYLMTTLELSRRWAKKIQKLRAKAKEEVAKAPHFHLDWELDSSKSFPVRFRAYGYGYKNSEVTGADRLYYDRSDTLHKFMHYYGKMKPLLKRDKPQFYIIRKGYYELEERLKMNGVTFTILEKDSLIRVSSYRIQDLKTTAMPFEKHYMHYNTSFVTDTLEWQFRKGDLLIAMGTDKDRFLVESLEPDAPDSYFNWNFFDAILQQKEFYSAYVFEDKAAALLASDALLKSKFERKKLEDTQFASDPEEQLRWVYRNSPYYEKEHMRLPVFRIE